MKDQSIAVFNDRKIDMRVSLVTLGVSGNPIVIEPGRARIFTVTLDEHQTLFLKIWETNEALITCVDIKTAFLD